MDAREALCDEAPAVGRLQRHAHTVGLRVACVEGRHRRERDRLAHCHAVRGAELAREADDRHRVDAVCGDLDVEHRLLEAEVGDHVGAGRDALVELEDAVLEPLRGQGELFRAAQHALRVDAAHLARLDVQRRSVAHEERADRRDRHDLARRDVRCGGRDRQQRLAADVDGAHGEAVGVGVLLDGRDAAGDHAF